ncbi:Diguanylate cyclase, GGDEF domain [Ferrimonas sediminum]|uniref:diguanylate cyclase n=1 Tax=Ferrimonas sediminum TaxID=718193 RepID=A0A1G8TAA1_9GAMM|nr:GGDEF domain-containing protein [Ferrimonas sediminum]SDJ38539.1 Diguanylate cyclase, GGDEF domain [Ferrimonas sediminum]
MSHRLIQLCLALFLAASVLFLPSWLVSSSYEIQWLLQNLPWVLLASAWIVSRIYRLQKLSFMVLVSLASYGVIQWKLQVPLPQGNTELIFWGLCLLAPLLVFLLDVLPEKWIATGRGGFAYALLLAPVALFSMLLSSSAEATHRWLASWVTVLGGYPLPWVLTLMMACYFVISTLIQTRRRDKGDSAALLCLMALGLTCYQFDTPGVSSSMFTILGLCLLVLLMLHSYRLAFFDLLTGVRNRRSLDAVMQGLSGRYQLAMIDIDHFKTFNDTFGHDVGDDVLRLVAQMLTRVKAGGTVYRYGGEEFTIVFRSRERKRCLAALDAIREEIAAYPFYVRSTQSAGVARRSRSQAPKVAPQTITVSMGLAQPRAEDANVEQVVKRADEALYQAKQAGRNCIKADRILNRRPSRRRVAA